MKTPSKPYLKPLATSPAASSNSDNIKLTGGLSRRHMLIGLAALIAGAGFWNNPLVGLAQAQVGSAPPATPDPATPAFLQFSTAITGHSDLNHETAGRIAAAMGKNYPDFATQLPKLSSLLQDKLEPKELLVAATDAGLRDLALAIVAAWYTGTVGHGKSAVVVSYAEALMYQPVADAQTVPTYCNYGPLWWTKAPPAIRVSAPTAPAPAPRPATTGTPEPKSKSHSL